MKQVREQRAHLLRKAARDLEAKWSVVSKVADTVPGEEPLILACFLWTYLAAAAAFLK